MLEKLILKKNEKDCLIKTERVDKNRKSWNFSEGRNTGINLALRGYITHWKKKKFLQPLGTTNYNKIINLL